jgi:signal transduction histidine kinase
MDTTLYIKLQTIVLAIIAVVNFILAALIFLRSREKSTLYFIGAIFGVSAWATGIALYIQPNVANELALILSRWNYVWGGLVAVFFMFFGLYFGAENRKLATWKFTLAVSIALIVSGVVLFPSKYALIVSKIDIVNGLKVEEYGSLYLLYVVYVLSFFSIGFQSLVNRFKKSSGVFRTRLIYIFAGSSISTTFAVVTNILLPYFGSNPNYVWLGPVGTLALVIGVSYAITRHGLWDFKLVAMELFTSSLVIILLIQMLVSEGRSTQIINGLSFFFMLFFGYYLIRGLLAEIESRERIERLAENLSAANKRLLELDVEKSDFVSIASHQLRTPLTVIKGYASMLLEGTFGVIEKPAHKEAIDKIYQASQRLVLMIEDFLNISRIEKGEMVYNMAQVDFRELVKEVITDLSTTLKGEKLDITFESPQSEDFYITGDHLKLRQVVSNIIDNSMKYTPLGGKINVKLTKDEKQGSIIFSVSDNGVGLTKEALDKLFQKFSRAKGMSKLHTEGRGLGLYVAKQIVEAHGGQIKAYSPGKDQGSTFTAVLPDMSRAQRQKNIDTFIQNI